MVYGNLVIHIAKAEKNTYCVLTGPSTCTHDLPILILLINWCEINILITQLVHIITSPRMSNLEGMCEAIFEDRALVIDCLVPFV